MLIAPRNADGSLPYSTFARLKDDSFLIDCGTAVDGTIYRGIEVNGIEYNGTAPDLGAYETSYGTAAIETAVSAETDGGIRFVRTNSGLLMLVINKTDGTAWFKADIYNAEGKTVASKTFAGTTSMLPVPQHRGVFIVKVENKNGWKATARIAVR